VAAATVILQRNCLSVLASSVLASSALAGARLQARACRRGAKFSALLRNFPHCRGHHHFAGLFDIGCGKKHLLFHLKRASAQRRRKCRKCYPRPAIENIGGTAFNARLHPICQRDELQSQLSVS
jgi:hypothetical protein